MRRPQTKDLAIYTLAILAGIQLLVLGVRVAQPDQVPLVWPQVGDTISWVGIHISDGRETQLPLGDPTVLLVFDPGCVHCTEVATLWRDWLRTQGPAWQVLAVSAEGLESARTYADGQEWEVEVGVVETGANGEMAAALTGRAPWVFVASGAGEILAEGHGDRLPELVRGVGPLADRVAGP